MSTTVRVSEDTKERLASLAKRLGKRQQAVLEEAVAAYEREHFWQQVDERYAELRRDPAAWADIERERTAETGVLLDRSQ